MLISKNFRWKSVVPISPGETCESVRHLKANVSLMSTYSQPDASLGLRKMQFVLAAASDGDLATFTIFCG